MVDSPQRIMRVKIRSHASIPVLSFTGPIEFGDSARLATSFCQRLASGDNRFVFDLRELAYIESTFMAETVACLKRARERSGDIRVVVAAGSKVDQVLRIAALDRVMRIFEDLDAALRSFAAEP